VDAPIDEWISTHHVCWEIVPTRARNEGGHPGFELTLLALCGGGRIIDPGRSECHVAHERLAEIVSRVVPPGQPSHVEAFDAAVHLRPESAFAPEVELVAELFPEPTAAARVRSEIETALGRLGVRAKVWWGAAAAR